MTDKQANLLTTTKQSLELVELIKELNGAQVSELVDSVDMSRSSLNNHLKTLKEHGYLIKRNGKYRIGLKFFNLGEYARKQNLSHKPIYLKILEISEQTEFEVDFSVEDQYRVMVIFEETSSSNWDSFQLGQYLYMHTNAAGKAILAEYPNEYINTVIDRTGLPKRTHNTIDNKEKLLEEIGKIRENGYAINDRETIEGIQAVATTIKEPTGEVIGGLTLTGPTYRFPEYGEAANTLLSYKDELEEEILEEWERKFHQ